MNRLRNFALAALTVSLGLVALLLRRQQRETEFGASVP